jgi:hypothetical protein
MQKSRTLCLATLDETVLRIANACSTAAACMNVTCERSQGFAVKEAQTERRASVSKGGKKHRQGDGRAKSTDNRREKAPTRQREKSPPYYFPGPVDVCGLGVRDRLGSSVPTMQASDLRTPASTTLACARPAVPPAGRQAEAVYE